MSRVVRINVRVVERAVWILIVLALAVVLFMNWGGSSSIDPDVDITALQQEIQDLQAANQDLENELAEAQQDLAVIEEAKSERSQAVETAPEPEPVQEEDALSGRIDVSWTVRMDRDDSDKLASVAVIVENGLENTQALEYTLEWDTMEGDVTLEDNFVVRSGERWADTIFDGSGFPSNPGPYIDTLVLTITDNDGNIIDRLEKEVK